MRKDIPIGLAAAQVVHAAGESALSRVPKGTHAVVLQVDNQLNLKTISNQLDDKSIDHVVISESDKPYCGELTAIGLMPITSEERDEVKKVLSSLKLYGGKHLGCEEAKTSSAPASL